MGQKTSPIALRLDLNRIWDSSWNSPYHYDNLLGREIQLRKYFARVFQRANLLCGRLVIHWNPQSIQIYPFLFPEKPKQNKRKKTKSKLRQRLDQSGSTKEGGRPLASPKPKRPLSSRILAQIESQREKTLQKRADFQKQVLFQRENFLKTYFNYQQTSVSIFELMISLQKPFPTYFGFPPDSQVDSSVVLNQSYQWYSKKHLWQRKKYLASWGISSYKKQKLKKAEGNLYAYLSKEKEGKVRKKERNHKKKILVKKRLNFFKKKRTLARKKSTSFSNKSRRLDKKGFAERRFTERRFTKSFNKLSCKASPQRRNQLFSSQGLTIFGRVFLQRPRKEKLKQKARHESSLETPEKPQELANKQICVNSKYWELTKEERILLLDEKKSNFSNKKRLFKRLFSYAKRSHPLSIRQLRMVLQEGERLRLGYRRARKRVYLPNVRNKSKPLSSRAIRCLIRSIAKAQGYSVVHRVKQDKLVVKQRENKGNNRGSRSAFRKAAKRRTPPYRTLPSPTLPTKTPVQAKGIYKLSTPKRLRYKLQPKLLPAHGGLPGKLPSPKTLGPPLVSFQPRKLKAGISKLSEDSKDFWKRKFSSKKSFLQVSLASAFLSSCWREKLFAIRGQLLHNFFLCESLSLQPKQNLRLRPSSGLWQKKRNKFKNSTALGYLEEHLQRIYQSQVQILPIKLKSSLPYKGEPVFCYQSALVLAEQLARAIEKKKIRTYRQVVRTALKQAKNISWLQGVRITCSGRLGRVDLAKQETKAFGETSLHVFSKKIDYGFASARTKKVGIVGIKVWLSFV